MSTLWVVVLLGVAVHQLVNYVIRPLKALVARRETPLTAADVLSIVTPWVAFAVGVGVAWCGQVDLLAKFMVHAPDAVTRGLTAALVGAGAEVLHEIAKNFRKYADAVLSIAPELDK